MTRLSWLHRPVGRTRLGALALLLAMVLIVAPAHATNGHWLHAVGPVNEGMGGAGTGTGNDLFSTIQWNPAGCVSCAPDPAKPWRLTISATAFVPSRSLSSHVTIPNVGTFDGTSKSKTHPNVLPSFAAVYHPEGPIAYHFGLISTAGMGVDYSTSVGPRINPILAPPPMGFGRIQSSMAIMRMPLGLSYKLTDKMSVGFSVLPTLAMLKVSPAPFAAPGPAGYPDAHDIAKAFGLGFQVGMQYRLTDTVTVGASYESPTWFQKFNWEAHAPGVAHRHIGLRLDLPAFFSFGVGWLIRPGTLLAADVRWFNYHSTRGFRGKYFKPDASVGGFGWDNIWVFAIGLEQDLGKGWKARIGYNFGQNPVPDSLSFFNTPAPAVVMHHLSCGLSYKINDTVTMHLSYYYAFPNSISGPMYMANNAAVPGSKVESELHEHAATIGFTFAF